MEQIGNMRNAFSETSVSTVRALPHFPGIDLGGAVRLRRGRIHEIVGAAADIFALLAVAEYGQDIVWIGLRRDIETLSPAGLQDFADPQRMLLVQGVSRGELLWAAEQALRADGAFAVILEMPDALSLRESRRLQLAAEEGGGFGLVRLHRAPATSAAQTRWHCTAVGGETSGWVWRCTKGKNGEVGCWKASLVGDGHAENTLHLVATTAA